MNVIWKELEDTKGNYSVSTDGRVRRNAGFDSIGRSIKETILSPAVIKKSGAKRVSLCIDGVMSTKIVSRLVAQAFLSGGGAGHQVRHKDKNPSNNRVDNLYWIKNEDDRGENNGFSALSEPQVKIIREMAKNGMSSKFVASKFRISQSTVRDIVTGRSWAHLPIMKDRQKNGNCWTKINY